MATRKQPAIRVTLHLEKYPSSLGTTTYRWGSRPFADAGAFTQGRVERWGTIERGSSTPDGDYDIAHAEVELSDSDGLFRGLLADPSTRYVTGREAAIEVLSEDGRAAALDWRSLMRGRVSSIQVPPGRKARIKIADEVGSHFSGFDLEKKLGIPISRREHPNASDKVVNRIYPIIIGEHSDYGVTDANGNPADKGLLPVIDVGDYLLDTDGNIYDNQPLSYLTAPANLAADVNGTPGTVEYVYGVSAVSPYGETTIATVTVSTAPTTLTGTDNVDLSWDAQAAAVEYRVYRDGRLLARLNNNETYLDPETTYTDDGSDSPGGIAPSATNTALVDQVLDDGSSAFAWGRLILKIGAAAEVHHLYASDLAEGTAPKRVRVAEYRYNSEFLIYGRPGWPHADPYIEINGIRMGVAYARGAALKHHRDGVVTIAWNGCGDDEDGDGFGDTIDEAFPALQHVLNEHRLKSGGVGYKTGAFGPLETYSNGVEKLKSSAYAACQALTVTWIGGRGYLCAMAITEPITLRDFLRRFCVTFACHMTSDHHGQVYPFLIDDTASTSTGRHYRARIEIMRVESQEIDHDAVETRVTFHYDWDADGQAFRVTDQVVEDAAATEAYLETPRERSARQCYYTRDAATALDSNSRHLTRYKVAPRYLGVQTDFRGLEDENGEQIRVTDHDGAGGTTGDVATPMLVMSHTVHPHAPEHVVLRCLDLGRILSTGFPLLGDKTSIAANLYDKTNLSSPPDGAYELR